MMMLVITIITAMKEYHDKTNHYNDHYENEDN